jgi:hypothetical protein
VVVDTLSYQHPDAACAVDGLMGDERLSGVVRGRKHRTTIPGGAQSRPAPDLLDRNFTAAARRVSCREKVREASVQLGGGSSNTSSHRWFSSSDCQAISHS